MADKSIGDLPKAAALYDNDRMVLEQNGEAKSMEGALLKSYILPYAQTAEQAAEAAESALEGVREAIENIPEGTATPIVNNLTTGGASMALSAEMGKVLGQRPNPNLLDNWYFGNPVNQRGQTEYKTNGYTVDRWKSSASSNIIAIADGYVEFTVASSGQSIQQTMERWEELKGKTLTASMLLATGATARICLIVKGGTTVRSAYISSGIASVTATIPEEATDVYVAIQSNSANSAVKLLAAKLELGTQQTLAHQDANGNWVLNEIPDYNEQLLRCCMSTADSSDTYANNKLTAAAVNAAPLDGSKAMTGALNIRPTNTAVGVTIDPNASALTASLLRFNNNGNVWGMLGFKSANAPMLRTADGTKDYTILHTGNKPSGSYTGNGDATKRTIDTGGLGSVCEIDSLKGKALVTYYGAIAARGDTIFNVDANSVNFRNGVLSVLTTDETFNASGTTYYYNVL